MQQDRRDAISAYLELLEHVREKLLRELHQNVRAVVRLVTGTTNEETSETATTVYNDKQVEVDGTLRVTLLVDNTDFHPFIGKTVFFEHRFEKMVYLFLRCE